MCGGAATNLAAATGKIPITVVTIRLLDVIEMLLVHEVDWFHPLLGELDLVSANILAESNAVLLEEVMIIQGRTIFETMLPPTHNTMLRMCRIWIFSNRKCGSATIVAGEHVIGSVFSIRDLNLQEVEAGFLTIRKWPRNIFIGSTLITVAALFRVGPVA